MRTEDVRMDFFAIAEGEQSLALTIIGKPTHPDRVVEHLFVSFDYLLALFSTGHTFLG